MISVDGRFEDSELNLIEKLFKGRLDKGVILDIGANIGNHTLAFSKISKKVYAFEPNIFVFELLKINTKRLKNVEIFNFGASDRNQSIVAKIPKLNWGGGLWPEMKKIHSLINLLKFYLSLNLSIK